MHSNKNGLTRFNDAPEAQLRKGVTGFCTMQSRGPSSTRHTTNRIIQEKLKYVGLNCKHTTIKKTLQINYKRTLIKKDYR